MLGHLVAEIGEFQNTIFSRTLVLERTRMSEEPYELVVACIQ